MKNIYSYYVKSYQCTTNTQWTWVMIILIFIINIIDSIIKYHILQFLRF